MKLRAAIVLLSLVVCVSAFPGFEDINRLFGSLSGSRASDHHTSDHHTSAHHKSRTKRSRPSISDRSGKLYEVETDDIPRHKDPRSYEIVDRYMPVLGNGHIGTTVYNYTVFMNNYYSRPEGGKNGETHRTAIPAKVMFRVNFTDYEMEKNAPRRYRFNIDEGFFQEEIDSSFATIQTTMYVHRRYTTLLIMHLHVVRKGSQVGEIILEQKAQNSETVDLNFEAPERFQPYGLQQKATQKGVEEGGAKETLYMFWNTLPPEIQIGQGGLRVLNRTWVMSVHTDQTKARLNFEDANRLINRDEAGSYELFTQHTTLWKQTWENTGILTFTGNTELTKIARFGFYNLLISLPALESTDTKENDEFTIMSRTGLGRGAIGKDYQGHVFWDSDMYIVPALVFWRPDLVKRMLRYRVEKSTEASNLAGLYGDEGIRYPWESAKVGKDVTPDSGATCRDMQIHINGAVSFAMRTYWSATREESARTAGVDNLCDVTRKLADFYYKRAVYNTQTHRYHIEGVTGPDDSHPNVTNNAYTNAIASLTLHWADYFACVCGRGSNVPQDYLRKAIQLYMPYSENSEMHFAFQDMDRREEQNLTTFKQADTTLLGFPLLWNMSSRIQKNDLDYYGRRLPDNAPGLSHALHAGGYAMAGDTPRANEEFFRHTADYIAKPFHIWTEYREDSETEWRYSASNFLPAIGAFLQASVSGWAGLRLRPEQIDIHRALMPSSTTEIKLERFKYLGNKMTLTVTRDGVRIEVLERQRYTLRVRRNSTRIREEFDLNPGDMVELRNMQDGYIMFAVEKTNCDVPADYIETIYSPWVNRGVPAARPASLWRSLLPAVLGLLFPVFQL